jgi:hypothetical protein
MFFRIEVWATIVLSLYLFAIGVEIILIGADTYYRNVSRKKSSCDPTLGEWVEAVILVIIFCLLPTITLPIVVVSLKRSREEARKRIEASVGG